MHKKNALTDFSLNVRYTAHESLALSLVSQSHDFLYAKYNFRCVRLFQAATRGEKKLVEVWCIERKHTIRNFTLQDFVISLFVLALFFMLCSSGSFPIRNDEEKRETGNSEHELLNIVCARIWICKTTLYLNVKWRKQKKKQFTNFSSLQKKQKKNKEGEEV